MTVITSPVKRFPGTVTLPDFLILPQVLAWDETLIRKDEIKGRLPQDREPTFPERKKFRGELDAAYLPAIFGIVQEWHIEGVPDVPTIENFPLTPRTPSAELTSWLIREIEALYYGEIDIPNA